MDRDRSGSISTNELQQALSNGTNHPFNPETCRLMLGTRLLIILLALTPLLGMFDRDGDGEREHQVKRSNRLLQFKEPSITANSVASSIISTTGRVASVHLIVTAVAASTRAS